MPVLLAAVKISGITVSFEFNGSYAIVSSLVVHYSVGFILRVIIV